MEDLETDCCPLFMQNHLRIHCLPCAVLLLPWGKDIPPALTSALQIYPNPLFKETKVLPTFKKKTFFILTKVAVVYSEFWEKKLCPVNAPTGTTFITVFNGKL